MIVVASKIDAMQSPNRLRGLKQLCKKRGLALYPISAHSGEGIDALMQALAGRLAEIRDASRAEAAVNQARNQEPDSGWMPPTA